MRLIREMPCPHGGLVRIYRHHEWDKYIVRSYDANGFSREVEDYHTDDKDDALDTASCIAEVPKFDIWSRVTALAEKAKASGVTADDLVKHLKSL